MDKITTSIKIDRELWYNFKKKCIDNKVTLTKEIEELIKGYLKE